MYTDYELAGFTDESGRMGRPVPSAQIVIPQKIWLKDDCIRWQMGKKPQIREVSRSMLNQFIRLRDADSVLQFAREWGVLALSGNLWTGKDPGGEFYLPGRAGLKEGIEPIYVWQYYAKRAQAVLNVSAALKQGKLGDLSDWSKFAMVLSEPSQHAQVMQWLRANMDRHRCGLGLSVINGQGTPEERLTAARGAVASEVGYWLDCWKQNGSRVSDFGVRWVDDQQRWGFQIDYHGLLFPGIALQLALVLADADSLYCCSGCGIPYIRPRERKRPKSGWANYCDQCSKDGLAQRRAAKTYRQKLVEAVRLHSEGASISEVARQLETEASRIRRWIEKGGNGGKTKARK